MSANVLYSFIDRSSCAFRSASVAFQRGSAFTSIFVASTSLSFVMRIVYVPGRTRGPAAPAFAAVAAFGTGGGGMRIDQVTRERPRRLLLGIVSICLLPAS